MRARRGCGRRGVTAGEVLAGIVILGVLFGAGGRPGRWREEDQQACRANIKQICAAIQMYLADYDRLPPAAARPEVADYFNSRPGGGRADRASGLSRAEPCRIAYDANPYLRWPVILDPYLETRGVWRCPSARLKQPAALIVGSVDWFGEVREHEADWGSGTDICLLATAWPAGWGGEVTDSFIQGRPAAAIGATVEVPPGGAFVQSIAVNTSAAGKQVRQVGDPAWYVIAADGGAQVERIGTGTLAYPDICALECANEACGWADWEECVWAVECGLHNYAPKDGSFLRNPELRKQYTRHQGGVNIGFLDGHAEWLSAEQVIAESPSVGHRQRGHLRGYEPWGPTSDCGFEQKYPGVPTLY